MDSSLGVGPPAVGRPLRLVPFRGRRLNPGRIGDPATGRLFARPYRDVSERLARWRADGQLREDLEPALYVHEYTAAGLTVRGLVGALDLSHRATGLDDRAVVPHERIHSDQVAGLADRMATWELDPAPIILVHRGSAAVRELVDEVVATPPAHEYVDRADQQHRVWAVTDPEIVARVNRALDTARAIIADGHHRYAAYLRLQQDHPGGANDRGLAMLVDQLDTPLFLGAIHRVFLGVTLDELSAAARPTARFAPVTATEALAALAPDTLVATDGVAWGTITFPVSGDDRAAVEVLHDRVLPALDPAPRRVGFHHSVDEALRRVRSTRGVAVLMPAPDFDLVDRIAGTGRLLPEKATSFQPKPSIGVLIRSLHDE
jgi:uncharacterized protein (DUF1015 family)